MALLGRGFPVAPLIGRSVSVGTPTLVVADASQAQVADTVVLVVPGALTVAGSTQAQTGAVAGALTQHQVLTGVAGSTQSQTAGTVTLGLPNTLVVAGSAQAQNARPVGLAPDGYYFRDEFSGSAIDIGLWKVSDRGPVPGELQVLKPANMTVSAGLAKSDIKFEDAVSPDDGLTYHYTAGQIETRLTPFLYGDIRVRYKLCGGIGIWPTIFLAGFEWQVTQELPGTTAPGENWPVDGWFEIDMAEWWNNARTSVNTSSHYQTGDSLHIVNLPGLFDASTQFAVYRLVWTPTSLTWMVDPEDGTGWNLLRQITGTGGSNIPNVPGFLVLNCAVGSNGGGTPDSSTYPQQIQYDYVRILRDVVPGLTVASSTQAQTAATVTLTYHPAAVSLAVANASQTQTAATVALTQHQVLAGVADSSQTQTAAVAGALTQHQGLAVAGAGQTQTADTLALTQHQVLVVAGSSQTQTADTLTLTQHQVLAGLAASSQTQTAATVALTQHQVLAVADASQTQTAGTVALGLPGLIAAAASSQTQTADTVALTAHAVLTGVAGSTQSQTAATVVISPTGSIAAAGSSQTQTAAVAGALVQHQILLVADSSQGQTTNNVVLTPSGALTVAGSSQGQTAVTVALTQHQVLVVTGASQGQVTDAVVLAYLPAGSLAPAASSQAQTAGSPVLVQHQVLVVANCSQGQHGGAIDSAAHGAEIYVTWYNDACLASA